MMQIAGMTQWKIKSRGDKPRLESKNKPAAILLQEICFSVLLPERFAGLAGLLLRCSIEALQSSVQPWFFCLKV